MNNLIDYIKKLYIKSEIENNEIEIIVAHVLNFPNRNEFLKYLITNNTLDNKNKTLLKDIEIELIESMISRRKNKEPINYIIGQKEFRSLTFNVDRNVLIPRNDTEVIVDCALEIYKSKYQQFNLKDTVISTNVLKNNQNFSILDLGTGSGCLLISIIYEINNLFKDKNNSFNSTENTQDQNSTNIEEKMFNIDEIKKEFSVFGLGVDISKECIKIAKDNAKKNNVNNAFFFLSNWFENIRSKFNIIVCNPPYISKEEIESLEEDVKFYEPYIALSDNDNGYKHYKKIIRELSKYLTEDGYAIFEVGIFQSQNVQKIFAQYNFEIIKVAKDLQNIERAIVVKLKKNNGNTI